MFDKYCHIVILDVSSLDLLHGPLTVGNMFYPVRILYLPVISFSILEINICTHSNEVCSLRELR